MAEVAPQPWRWIAQAAAVSVAVFALLTLVPPWLSARQVEFALQSVSGSDEVFDDLDRARALNPFTSEPDVLGAVIASQRGDVVRQRSLLSQAIGRNPYDWFPYVEIGLLDARQGNRKAGLAFLEHALTLNPRDASIQFATERVRAGRPPSPAEMKKLYLASAALCCLP